MNFKRLNNILGWVVFAISLVVYTMTMEKTGSLWDCGEFLGCTYKLQVAHPPGAPFYMLVGKVFSLFAFGNEQNVAMCINFLSALSSAFCVLFFFWSSTILLKMVFSSKEESKENNYMVLATSFIASLAATFLDSMWFNALEGEVYAFSVFFMSFNVWAILKWKEDNSQKRDYWLLLIALFTGMSLGVHLLSLLVFPMIGIVIFHDKFKFSWLGFGISFLLSVIMIQVTMSTILVTYTSFLGALDLFFVNSVGLPFNSGAILGVFLTIAGFYYFLKKSQENPNFLKWNEGKTKFSLNTIILFFAFLMFGYTSYFMVVIRANANTPINMNVPDNFKTLKTYIAREQYGDRPLFKGPNYTQLDQIASIDVRSENFYKDTKSGKYINVGNNQKVEYTSEVKKFFPRLGHEGEDKKSYYRLILNPSYDVIDRNTNSVVQTFPKGQQQQAEAYVQQMNKQNNSNAYIIKDHLTFFDNVSFFLNFQVGFMYMRYLMWNFAGRTEDLQGTAANDYGRWMSGIPFIDNLTDIWGNTQYDMTNSPKAYNKNKARNTFYLIPFILCIMGMIYNYKKNREVFSIILVLFFATGIFQILYHNQPPVEPRERDYVVAPSFYAFAFWMPFAAFMIYDFLKKKINSLALPLSLVILAIAPILMGMKGWDDHNRGGRTSTFAYAKNVLKSCPQNAILFAYGDNDTYPLWYAQEVENYRTDVRVVNTSLIEAPSYISQLYLPMNKSMAFDIGVPFEKLRGQERGYIRYIPGAISADTVSAKELLNFITSDEPENKTPMQDGTLENFIPTTHIYFDIDKNNAVKNGFCKQEDLPSLPSRIYIELPEQMSKGAILQLALLTNNVNKRPICYVNNAGRGFGNLNLKNNLELNGMIWSFNPYTKTFVEGLDPCNMTNTHNILKNFEYGNIEKDILLDENTKKSYQTMKSSFVQLGYNYAYSNNNAKASEILSLMYKKLPLDKIGIDNLDVATYTIFGMIKDTKNRDFIKTELYNHATSVLDWYTNSYNIKKVSPYNQEIQEAMNILNVLKSSNFPEDENFKKKVSDKFNSYESKISSISFK